MVPFYTVDYLVIPLTCLLTDPACGQSQPLIASSSVGNIASPLQDPMGGPIGLYPNNASCSWLIEVHEGDVCSQYLKLHVIETFGISQLISLLQYLVTKLYCYINISQV